MTVNFTVNGKPAAVDVPPATAVLGASALTIMATWPPGGAAG